MWAVMEECMPLIRLQQAGACGDQGRAPELEQVQHVSGAAERMPTSHWAGWYAGRAVPLAAPVEDALLWRGGGVVDALEHVLQPVSRCSCWWLRWLAGPEATDAQASIYSRTCQRTRRGLIPFPPCRALLVHPCVCLPARKWRSTRVPHARPCTCDGRATVAG